MGEEGAEIAMRAVLRDDVVEILSFVCVVEFDQIRMADDSMDFYFILQHGQV